MPGYVERTTAAANARPHAVVKDRVIYVWERECAAARDRTVEQERRLKSVRLKLDRLDEAFLYSESIDLDTYSRQRDRLREELTLSKGDHLTEAVEELDVEGILAFAERILPRAADPWAQANSNAVKLSCAIARMAGNVSAGRRRIRSRCKKA